MVANIIIPIFLKKSSEIKHSQLIWDDTNMNVHENCPIFKATHLGRPISNKPPNDNRSWSPVYMLSGPSFRFGLVFSINWLILPGFSLTSFNFAETSRTAFSWLYTLAYVAVQKYNEMSFIYNYTLCFICFILAKTLRSS